MIERLTKSAIVAATTTGVGWAAELVSSVTSGFWRDEQSPSVYGLLQQYAPPLTFGNENCLIVPFRPLVHIPEYPALHSDIIRHLEPEYPAPC